ncbi:MAG: hypothetical protein N4A68_13890 [Maledivibacter sp.]|jgi:protocatechuate 3,4-dioxygenase beta subunit|nr:hypothetical protein [Maledivibacter sp.]
MANYSEIRCDIECPPVNDTCESVVGNVTKAIEIDKNTKVCEIRADLEVKKIRTIRLWGQVRDCDGDPVKCALVKLVKLSKGDCKGKEYEGVAHGVTDCMGFYQFDICVPKSGKPSRFRVIVSKQAVGTEIKIKKAACDPCNGDSCDCVKC